ncbi:hypothetical protein A0H76_926 [Hepatospora eriocheir]|uniref:Uncharacterized protein n=1 Tax=Hepatospora eriocheir TaxID=1081669 RepID=A0A1X0QKY4_9MICR|nr:hypothetical protein A0H76_926 [Hepatospora eriocheir]
MVIEQEANEDEIEYFGFVPYCFTLELQQCLEDEFNDTISELNTDKELAKQIVGYFRKNCFMMVNYMRRNILKFPENFKYERLVTDEVVEDDIQEILSDVNQLQKEKTNLMKKINELKIEKIKKINISSGYKSLLKHKEDYYNLKEHLSEIKKLVEKTELKYASYVQNGDLNGIKKLMQHKNIENEYFDNELVRLERIGSIETLKQLKDNLN